MAFAAEGSTVEAVRSSQKERLYNSEHALYEPRIVLGNSIKNPFRCRNICLLLLLKAQSVIYVSPVAQPNVRQFMMEEVSG